MRLHVQAADSYFYPDLMVVCAPAPGDSDLVKNEALLIAEVLSPSTGAYDRGDKFAAYRQLPSLREYPQVDVDRQRCDLFRKGADGLWVLQPSEAGQAVHLASVDLTVPPEALWADLEPTAAGAADAAAEKASGRTTG